LVTEPVVRTSTTALTEVLPELVAVVVRCNTLVLGCVSTRMMKLLALADAPALNSPTTAPPVRAATASFATRSNSNAAYGAQTKPWIDSCLLLPDPVVRIALSPRTLLATPDVSSACRPTL
jgi:hypothetical protein